MSIPSWARIGAKVVCIEHSHRPGDGTFICIPPPIGEPVIISRIIAAHDNRLYIHRGPHLVIHGYHNFDPEEGIEIGWRVNRFRPVHTLRSDIRMIKSIVRELPAESRLDRLLEVLNQ